MKIILIGIPILVPSNYLRILMKNGVTTREVGEFKEKWCNENQIITLLIREKAQKYFIPPILDVGSGLGDIAYFGFPEKEAICIDLNKTSLKEYPLSKRHKRIQIDFFDYIPEKQINTIFISHTLQFLDQSVPRLNEKIKDLNPRYLIMITNDNNDFLGEIVEWTMDHYKDANPEIYQSEFPTGYSLSRQFQFKAMLSCDTFLNLEKQIGYLMVIDVNKKKNELREFLMERLKKPQISFNQTIKIYTRDGR